jgi:hypothetical protein
MTSNESLLRTLGAYCLACELRVRLAGLESDGVVADRIDGVLGVFWVTLAEGG